MLEFKLYPPTIASKEITFFVQTNIQIHNLYLAKDVLVQNAKINFQSVKKNAFLIFIFIPFGNLFSQTFNLSNNLDKLILGKTTIKQSQQILGNPTKKSTQSVLVRDKQHNILSKKDRVLNYDSINNILRFDYKTKTLENIEIHSFSPVKLNKTIELTKSDTLGVFNSFGKPEISFKDIGMFVYIYKDSNNNEITLSFDKLGIINKIYISTQKYNKREIINY